jgi:two-component system response regulator MprA
LNTAGPRVAIVDDERHVRELLEVSLQRHGFETRTAADGQAGLRLIVDWQPDVVLLDVMLPRVDGITLLPLIRRHCEAPILMLSAKGDVQDRVTGIERGADDYLAKPFDIAELVARIRAALRRPHLTVRETLTLDDLVVDVGEGRVYRGEREIALTAREYALLCVLMRHPGRIFSRDHLLDRVWSDREVSAANVDTYVCYLRKKIDLPGLTPLIHTIRRMGYSARKP